MNKKFLWCLVSLVCILLLGSCGTPKYVGQWYIGQASLSKIVDTLTPEFLEDYGIEDPSSEEADMLVGFIEYGLIDSDIAELFSLDLKEDGKFSLSSEGTSYEGTYSVSKDKILTLTVDNVSVEYGSFNKDFTELTIDAMKDSVGFVIPMEKKNADSKDLVFLWPEIEKGKDASLETVKALVENGADANYGANNYGERLFFAAIRKECPEEVVLYLIENTDFKYINACDEYGGSALLEALSDDENASYSIVKALLDAGADISLGTVWGYDPVQYAIMYCSDEIAVEVIAKASQEQINSLNDGITCLGLALSKDDAASVSVVKALLDAGADISLGTVWGLDTATYAKEYCSPEINLLLSEGGNL